MQEIQLVNQSRDCFDYLIGVTTPLIALWAAFFAFCQWRTYQKQYRAMITDRIVNNYEKLSKVQGYIIRHNKIDFEHLRLLALAFDEAKVCLPSELVNYLEALYERACRLESMPDLIQEKTQQMEELGLDDSEKQKLAIERQELRDEKARLSKEFAMTEHYKVYRSLLIE